MKNEIKLLKKLVDTSDNIVFFGGAGVSTESGIPDFRSSDGLYNQEFRYPPEVMLSRSFFIQYPMEFYRFYKKKIINENVSPNPAHVALAKLEKSKKLKAIITQNIDGLHQSAGSKNVLELHGSIYRNYCMDCKRHYNIKIIKDNDIPRCECGGIIRPDIVLYEESLNNDLLMEATRYLAQADVLIIGGTSLSVYPAAGLIFHYEGDKLVMINKSNTSFDNRVNLLIKENIGKVMSFVT